GGFKGYELYGKIKPPAGLARHLYGYTLRFSAFRILPHENEIAVVDSGAQLAAWRQVGPNCGSSAHGTSAGC
ncbi:MAG: hypothetical protein DMG19_04555, partial [Acidobacteria bacterium]